MTENCFGLACLGVERNFAVTIEVGNLLPYRLFMSSIRNDIRYMNTNAGLVQILRPAKVFKRGRRIQIQTTFEM
jgi:hypothetical protein